MRSLLARLAVLGAFAVSMSACGGGNGNSLPFAGAPNNTGGSTGTFQSSSNGALLLRFIQGSPDSGTGASGLVDVCVDNQPFGITGGTAVYGGVATGSSGSLFLTTGGGIQHTISVYPGFPSGSPFGPAGVECATAPGPYLGTSTIAVATLITTASVNQRWTVVLAGTKASGTLGLYVYGEPLWAIPASGNAVVSHNAAPAFSTGKANGVGFGQCTTTVTPCAVAVNLTGAQGIAKPNPTGIGQTTVVNGSVTSSLGAIPAGFYDGIGVPAGTVVPITSVPAPTPIAGQPYVVTQYAFDAPAGGLNLLSIVESTLGFGF